MDNSKRLYRYTNVSGLGVVDYQGVFQVKPAAAGCEVEWRVKYLADNQPTLIIKIILETLMKTGFAALKKRFGTAG